jgi:hypothetical protein
MHDIGEMANGWIMKHVDQGVDFNGCDTPQIDSHNQSSKRWPFIGPCGRRDICSMVQCSDQPVERTLAAIPIRYHGNISVQA